MSNSKPEPIAWIYEIQPPADDEWFEKASRFHPIEDENLDQHERVAVRNIRGLVEIDDSKHGLRKQLCSMGVSERHIENIRKGVGDSEVDSDE